MDIIRDVFTLDNKHAGLYRLTKYKNKYQWRYIDFTFTKKYTNYIRLEVDIHCMHHTFDFEEWHLEDKNGDLQKN